jgi:hypothetical protein
VPLPFVKVIVFEDTDAVTILLPTNDAVDAKDELIEVDAKELLIANELLIALDELIAKDAVPNNDPVNEPVNEPVLLKNAFQELPL